MAKDIVILMGPPGAGKGTLAHLCTNRMGWGQCSTGDLCRKHIVEKTALGNQIDLLIKSGKLISDSLIIEMVEDWLLQHFERYETIILDGFPRTKEQAELLDKLLQKPFFSQVNVSIVKMELDSEVVIKRLVSRLVCSNSTCCAVYSADDPAYMWEQGAPCHACAAPVKRRNDDVEHVIRDRLATYRTHVNSLMDYYRKIGRRVCELDVIQPVDQVFSQFMQVMNIRSV